jgi:hypothetical protein
VWTLSEFEDHLKTCKKVVVNNVSKPETKQEVKIGHKPEVKQEIKQNQKIESPLIRKQSERRDCNFCKLQLSMDELFIHENSCGSRSTICEYCNNKLLIKDLVKHNESCKARMMILSNQFDEEGEGIYI